MHDINFFSVYQKQSLRNNPVFIHYFNLALIAAAVLFAMHLVVFGVNFGTQIDLNKYNKLLASKEAEQMRSQISTLKADNNMLESYSKALKTESKNLEVNRLLDYKLVADICSKVPQPLTFTSMVADMSEISIICNSPIAVNAAELEHNLEQIDSFSSVHINSIKTDEKNGDEYEVDIICKVKGVEK